MNAPFVLAAGGTGGHLFPAQAVAKELLSRGKRVVVMTDGRGHNYGGAFPGAEIATVPSATFSGRSLGGRVKAVFVIPVGIASAWLKLKRLRPSAVVGFGGYPSLPVMLASALARVPMAVHEQNAVLGRVNRRLAPYVKAIAASFPFARLGPKEDSKIVFTGTPVRPEAVAFKDMAYTPPSPDGEIALLIFGGSQGARALSELVPAALALLPPAMKLRLRVTQQARAEDVSMVEESYRASGIAATVGKFFSDLPRRMAEAHLVIARSGASTLGELTVIGCPAILIPYPFAMDDHQAANAAVLEKAGAAWVIRQDALDAAKLAALLNSILADPGALRDHAAAAKRLGHPDAAAKLADLAEKIGEGSAA